VRWEHSQRWDGIGVLHVRDGGERLGVALQFIKKNKKGG